MDRSLTSLRRGLLGIAFVGSLAFGAVQALAAPRASGADGTCLYGDPGARSACQSWCQSEGYRDGTCTRMGFCACL